MILTGSKIREEIEAGNIEIDPFVPEHVGPNSVDLRLGSTLLYYDLEKCSKEGYFNILDMMKENPTIQIQIPRYGYTLLPGILYLGSTIERTWSDLYVPKVEGRSSVGRLGLKIHLTAGFGDLGFNGNWTLELEATHPLRIYPGVRICQVYFDKPFGEVKDLYRGRYQGHTEPTASRFHSGET
jgi:dCTP deaminase